MKYLVKSPTKVQVRAAKFVSLVGQSQKLMYGLVTYLALVTLVSLEALGAKGSLIIEGPFTRNKFYLDLMASVLEVDLYLSEESLTGTSIGSTLLVNNDTSNLSKIKKYDNPKGEYRSNMINYSKKWKQLVDK